VIAGVFFWLGALIVWFPALGHRRRARVAEKRAALLSAQLAERDKAVAVASSR
jgi:hypothetical protein